MSGRIYRSHGLILPADRLAIVNWQNAGMQSKGGQSGAGIPNRSSIFTTLTASVSASFTGTITIGSATSTLAVSSVTGVVAIGQSIFDTSNVLLGIISSGSGSSWTLDRGSSNSNLSGTIGPKAMIGTVDRSSDIQTAVTNALGAGGNNVVLLGAGIFVCNNLVQCPGAVTVRGAGAGTTIVFKTNGSRERLSSTVPGTTGIRVPVNPSTYTSDTQPIFIAGPGRFPGPDNSTSVGLTVDGVQGAYSVTVSDGTNFAIGQFVLLDELSGAAWVAVPPDPTDTPYPTYVWANDRINWSMWWVSNPLGGGNTNYPNTIAFVGDCNGADLTFGPYDFNPNYVLTAQSWAANVVTFTTTAAHFFNVGDTFYILNSTPSGYNGIYTAITGTSGTTLKATLTSNPGTSSVLGNVGAIPAAYSWFSRQNRITNEMKEVVGVSGNVITFNSPLMLPYYTSRTAQLTRYTNSGNGGVHTQGTGIEKMTLAGGNNSTVRFECAAYCWVKNCEITQWGGGGISISNSFRIEIRASYIQDCSWPVPSSDAYAIWLALGSSEILIENCIVVDTCKNFAARTCGAGSVISYNYSDNSFDYDANNPGPGAAWVEVSLNASHMVGPHHVLFEGNESPNFDSDATHGTSSHLVAFRNHLSGQRANFTDVQNVRCGGVEYVTQFSSFVGNVMGRSGLMSGWNLTDPMMGCDGSGGSCVAGVNGSFTDPDLWKIGYEPGWWSMHPAASVLNTTFRYGNYDFIQNAQSWYGTSPVPMPSSLYLTNKPAFFGSNTWPFVDPLNGTINTLPAFARYPSTPNITPNE